MQQSLTHLALYRPRLILWATLLLTLVLGSQIPFIQVDTDPENMLSADQPDRVLHNALKKRFMLYDMIVVGVVNDQSIYNPESLQQIVDLTDYVKGIDGVVEKDLMTLATVDNIQQEGPGTIRFNWLMQSAPKDLVSLQALRESIERLPLLKNTLVSEDGRSAALYVPIVDKHESHRIAESIREYLKTVDSHDEFHITGLPVAEDTFGVEMFIQMAVSAPLAALTVFLLMWYFFRSLSVVTSPMLMAMAVVISTMGLMIGLGYTVHIMSSMIPIFLMPIAVVDSVHILSEFSDRYRPGDDARKVMENVIGHLFTPMLFTSLTSGIGFASLALAPIPPVQVFGLFIAFGIGLAFLLTITFIPAYIVNLSPERLQRLAEAHHGVVAESRENNGLLARLLRNTGREAFGWSRTILLGALGLAGFSIWGLSQIQINDNPVRWFEEKHEIRVADKVLNEHFAGTYNVFVALTNEKMLDPIAQLQLSASTMPGAPASWSEFVKMQGQSSDLNALINALDNQAFNAPDNEADFWQQMLSAAEKIRAESLYFQQPDALRYIERFQQFLDGTGQVGKSSGLPDLVKTVYRELNAGDQAYARIPDTSAAVAQSILSYQSSHRPDDLWHMVTPDYRSTAVWLQLKSGDNQEMVKLLKTVHTYLEANPLPQGLVMEWGGLTYINVVWQDAMVNGMLNSLIGSFITVFLVMVVLFRSLVFGVLAMIPLSLTILFIYGVIGWVGKDYDMPIAVLSALTLGLSVDFAIHFLERTRAAWKQHQRWDLLMDDLFGEPARAITRNALVIALGFLPLLLAPLVPYKTVGFFLAAIMLTSCLATLLLLPALMNVLKPWLFKNELRK